MMKWLFVLVGVALFLGLVFWTGPESLAASLAGVNAPIFLMSPLLSLVILFVLTVRFRIVLGGVTRKWFGFWNLFRIFAISNVFALISPAKSGELVKSYFLKRQGLDYGRGIIVVVVERIVDLVAISFLLIIFALLSAPSFATDYITYSAALLALLAAGMFFFRSSLFIRVLRKLPIISKRLKEVETGTYREVLRGNLSARSMMKPLPVTMASIVTIAARMYVIFLSLGLNPDFSTVIFVYLLVIVVGIVSMIPGGLGSIEVAGAWLYSSVLGYDLATVATALILLRFSTFAVDIPAGVISSYAHGDKRTVTGKGV
jgi:hypothetical protein